LKLKTKKSKGRGNIGKRETRGEKGRGDCEKMSNRGKSPPSWGESKQKPAVEKNTEKKPRERGGQFLIV